MSGNIRDAWNMLRPGAAGLHVVSDNAHPLTVTPALLLEGPAIPPREWLYGTLLVRRFVSVLISPGGIGKTSWSVAVGASVAAGRQLIGDHVHVRTNVLFCSLEDPADEFDRRLAACMLQHQLDGEDLGGRISTINGRDRRLNVASLDIDGLTVCYPDKDALVAAIRAREIGLAIVDPFVNSHELDENSNPHINAAARAWAEIANETGCAVLLIHHTRKGAIAGDPDSGRGASALIGAARSTFSLTSMTTDEALGFGIPERERRLYIRLDDAKANLAPPADRARWFHLASVKLGNGSRDYPNGDSVQAIEEWLAPEDAARRRPEATPEAIALVAAEAARGSLFGAYAPRLAVDQPRSIAAVMVRFGITAPAVQKAVLQELFARGFTVQEFRDGDGDRRKGLRSPEGTPEMKWLGSTPE